MESIAPTTSVRNTGITLRPYQETAVTAVIEAERRGVRRQLLEMPTGCGKTVVFAEIIRRRDGRSLVLAHRDELLQQAIEKIVTIDPSARVGLVRADADEVDADIVVGSIQTLSRPARLARLGTDFRSVVVDEAHHAVAAGYTSVLRHVGPFEAGGPLLLGVTATVDRGDGVGLGKTFEHVAFRLELLDMIRQGYLADIRAIQVQIAADYNSLHTRGGDFVDSEAAEMFLDADGPAEVVAAFQQYAADRKAIAFTPTVAVAQRVAERFRDAGVTAAAVSGDTPTEERRQILRDLRAGDVQVVANCAVLTEGFDEPSVDAIVIARPTRSRGLYQQMIGRGSRLHPGKADCLVLDVVGATTRHDVQTVGSLLGIPTSALATRSVAEAVGDRMEAAERAQAHGQLVARSIDLFRRRPAHWVPIGAGRFVLPTAGGTIALQPRGGGSERWDVLLAPQDGPVEILGSDLDVGYAQGVAEDHVRSAGGGALIVRDAGWRSEPPTEKQKYRLRQLGAPLRTISTRGQASDAIAAGVALRSLSAAS